MLRNMMGWGGVGTHMVDATQHDGVEWGGGMMLTFLELTHMVDATQHDGVVWGGE